MSGPAAPRPRVERASSVDPLARLGRAFPERARISRARASFAYLLPRWGLTLALTAAFPLLLLVAILLDPDHVGRAATDAAGVEAVFSRLISAMATTATIAVSVATLTLGRELMGLRAQEERHRTNEQFRDAVRLRGGLLAVPMSVGAFLSETLRLAAEAAATAKARADAETLAREAEGVRLGDYLTFVEENARLAARRAYEARRRPSHLIAVALDFEQESTHHLARRFARERELGGVVQEALRELSQALKDVVITTRYLKSLDIQWGLSRMSVAILVSTLPAVAISVSMALLYGPGVPETIGVRGAGALVCLALGVVLLPLAAFVSYLVRFVFLNRQTLPTEDFVLGPEQPDVVDDLVPSGSTYD